MKNNESPNVCIPCGGKCCKALPGSCAPEDFKDLSYAGLKAVLLEGKYQIDYTIQGGNPLYYYIRPRTIQDKDKLLSASWGGQCILLTDTGCSLNFEERPYQCKTLVPKNDTQKSCEQPKGVTKITTAVLWRPYQGILKQILYDCKSPFEIDSDEMLFGMFKMLQSQIQDT